jgi:hypothetical protein
VGKSACVAKRRRDQFAPRFDWATACEAARQAAQQKREERADVLREALDAFAQIL